MSKSQVPSNILYHIEYSSDYTGGSAGYPTFSIPYLVYSISHIVKGCIKKFPWWGQVDQRNNKKYIPCTLHTPKLFGELGKYSGVFYQQAENATELPIRPAFYTVQSCEYFCPVPVLFVFRRPFVCRGGGALAAITR